MPTTIREQLLVGIHQTEKQLVRIKSETVRAPLAAELDGYLAEVRAASDENTEAIRPLYERLLPLHRRVMDAVAGQ